MKYIYDFEVLIWILNKLLLLAKQFKWHQTVGSPDATEETDWGS